MDIRFALLLACFFLSGFAALLYQTAWTRELSFVFGTSELAVAAVLAAYMGGLALGASAAARFATRLRRPVLAYGLLELGIALCALSVPAGIQLINSIYVALLGGNSALPEGGAALATVFQLGAAFAVLLPPTAFMGATLPLLARYAVHSESEIASRVGLLYAVNTAGAIAGTLCAAFWLMPELGLRHSVWVGAALNGAVFALAALLARGAASPPAPAGPLAASTPAAAASWILPLIALSGAVSFAYEVLWTRLLSHLLGSSLDAFASMLASFLLGIALGSALAARLATSRERAAVGFGVAQLGIAFTAYGAFALADRLPGLSEWLGGGPKAPLASAAVAVVTLLPITLCIGTTFPFAVRLLAQSPELAASATARTYAWNTVGAIVGALGAGFVLLPGLGFEGTVSVAVALNLGLAAITALRSRPRRTRLLLVAAAAGALLAALPARAPWVLLGASPLMGMSVSHGQIAFSAVGRSSTVLLFDDADSFRLYTNGLPEAVIERNGMQPRIEIARLLGLLPALLRPEAREMLVVGLGGGSALESIPSSIASIDVIELEPEVLRANQRLAAERAIDPLADPRVHVHIGDARSALQLTSKSYDAIISQPSHPWTAGASHLYTQEFFTRVRSRLKPDGVFVQWIGLNYVDEALLRSLAATLSDVFPHVEVYQLGGWAGLLFAASAEPLDSIEGARRALQAAPQEFGRVGFQRVEDFAAIRLLDEAGTRALAKGGELNTDDNNLLAARASRLADSALNIRSTRVLWKAHDPLLAGIEGLDRSRLIRRLIDANFADRATSLVLSSSGASRETGLGWIELGSNRSGRAFQRFARARELEPGSSDAVAGLLASQIFEISQGKPLAEVTESDLDDRQRALVACWRRAAGGDWNAVAALDSELARFEPGEPLFEEASRMRILWRLATSRPEAGVEAQTIVETLLARNWNPSDDLLRARAAILANRPAAAWGSLSRIVKVLPNHPRAAALAASALEIAKALPEELARDLQTRLRAVPARASGA